MIRLVLVQLLLLSGALHAQLANFPGADFQKADSIAKVYQGESLKSLPILAYRLTTPLETEVEKFRAIYTWVSTNIESDHGMVLKNRKMRKKYQNDSAALAYWNGYIQEEMFRKLLKRKKTVCTGYAYLVKELANLADIPCEIIDGYGRTVNVNIEEPGIPNHSWNAVQLNGRWYLCDATWSSGNVNLDKGGFIPDYKDGYFLADPTFFVTNHYPLDPTWLLMEDPPSLNEFLLAPLIYRDAFQYQILPLQPQRMRIEVSKEETFSILLQVPDSLEENKLQLELYVGGKKEMASPVVGRLDEENVSLSYDFRKRALHDVHIKVDDQYIATYLVRVRK